MLISVEDFKTAILEKEKRVRLLDVRTPAEFEHFHLEGAQLIPLQELAERGPRELDPNADYLVYCAKGVRSLDAVQILTALGFKKVRSLQGGLQDFLW